ncbi:MAG: exodeoxyribonuclease III [Burkholderiaceae bacterium]|jgi:exodeoxyribonuclease-3|nr:exodeoxyribonuclease III [Burkholderiaceae bacterium]
MKLATWNVNSLNVRLQHVLDWLAANPVDVLALQELKLTEDKFPYDALRAAGYEAAVFGQKTYNGVALLMRGSGGGAALADVRRGIAGYADDAARVLAATVPCAPEPLRVVNAYFVNGQAPGSEKFEYKMSWLRALRDALREELAAHAHLVLLGDFNIAPEDRDSFDPVGLAGTIHHTPEERDHFRKLLQLGLVDAFRLFEQPANSFSWWDYRLLGFQKNRGLRIDHILVSQALARRVKACGVDRAPRKWPKPSDHAPVLLELA